MSTTKKQSSLHSFFAKKGATAVSKENTIRARNGAGEVAATAAASAAAVPTTGTTGAARDESKNPPALAAVELTTGEFTEAVASASSKYVSLQPPDALEEDAMMMTKKQQKKKDTNQDLASSTPATSEKSAAVSHLGKRKAALKELTMKRKKRLVLEDDDDSDGGADNQSGRNNGGELHGADTQGAMVAPGSPVVTEKKATAKKASEKGSLVASVSADGDPMNAAPPKGVPLQPSSSAAGPNKTQEEQTREASSSSSSSSSSVLPEFTQPTKKPGYASSGGDSSPAKCSSASGVAAPKKDSLPKTGAAVAKNHNKATRAKITSSGDLALKSALPLSSPLAKVLKQVKSDEQLVKLAMDSWAKELTTALGEEDEKQRDLPYSALCQTWSKIEAVTSRLQIQEVLTDLFRMCLLLGVDLLPVLYLCCNEVAPAYKCVELGIGDAILIKAIAEATGTSPQSIKSQYESQGDLGNVAQTAKGSQRTLGGFFKPANLGSGTTTSSTKKGLTASHVLQVFLQIATTKGNQSQKWKTDCIKRLLVSADSKMEETKYIIRGLQGKLRIGLAESTVLISLAHAVALTVPKSLVRRKSSEDDDNAESSDSEMPEEARSYANASLPPEKRLEAAVAILKKAYSEVPSYEAVLNACLTVPLEQLHKECTLTPGIPVAPMLAKPTKSIQEVLKRLNGLKFTCEYKYDGERAQVHLLPDGSTRVFSRNLLDTSDKYPEVPIFVKEAAADVQSFVLDAEVVAFNNKTGQLVPFQVLSTRKKTEESAESAKVQVIVQAFDLMFLNGRSLLATPLEDRRELLRKHFKVIPGKFQFAISLDHEENGDTTVIEEFLDSAVKGQCEGLMIKTLNVNAKYEPSRRSLNWLKLKKDYLDGLGDSVDLVPLGAYYGRGKRTGVYGAYLLACYDPDTEEFQSVCKIGTGFSDEDLRSLAGKLNQHVIPKKSRQYNTTDPLECDVWFDAVQVWEVKAADLSKSSVHRCAEGKLEEGRGIGLRFPRFERVRDDKRPEDATTSDQILEMYYSQDAIVDTVESNEDGI